MGIFIRFYQSLIVSMSFVLTLLILSCGSQKDQMKIKIPQINPKLANVLFFNDLPLSCFQLNQSASDRNQSIDPRFAFMVFRDIQGLKNHQASNPSNQNWSSEKIERLINHQMLFVLHADRLKNQHDVLKALSIQNHFFALDFPISKKILSVIESYETLREQYEHEPHLYEDKLLSFKTRWQSEFHLSIRQLERKVINDYPTIKLISFWHSDLDQISTNQFSQKTQVAIQELVDLLLAVRPQLFSSEQATQAISNHEHISTIPINSTRWIEGSAQLCQPNQLDRLIDQIESKQIISAEKSLFADHFNPYLSFDGLKVIQIPKSFTWTNEQINQIQQCHLQIGLNNDNSTYHWAWVIRDFKDELLIFPFSQSREKVPNLHDPQSEVSRIYKVQSQINEMIFCHFKIKQAQLQPINHLDLNWYTLKIDPQQNIKDTPKSSRIDLNHQRRWIPKILGVPEHKPFKPLDELDFLELESKSPLSWEFKGILSELLLEIQQVERQKQHWPYFQASAMEMPIYEKDGQLIAVGYMLLFQYIPYLFLALESRDQNFELLSENLIHLRSPYLLLIPPQGKVPVHLWQFDGYAPRFSIDQSIENLEKGSRKKILPFSSIFFQQYYLFDQIDLKNRPMDFIKKGGKFVKATVLTMMPRQIWQFTPTSILATSDSLVYSDLRSRLKQKLGMLYHAQFFSESFSLKFQEKLSIDMGIFGLIELQTLSPSHLAE